MDAAKALKAGVPLAIIGGAGMIIAPMLGATALGKPWSFMAGFGVGIVCGLGVALVVYGLGSRGRES